MMPDWDYIQGPPDDGDSGDFENPSPASMGVGLPERRVHKLDCPVNLLKGEWVAYPITCRGCGETRLHWHDLNRDEVHPRAPQWKLYDEKNMPHVCKGNPEADKLAEGFIRRYNRNKLPIY